MGTDLRARSESVRGLFQLADKVTGLPISRLCADGPLERLTATDVAQPAVVTTSLAALAVLREELSFAPTAVAGHSVGEISAYVAAGALDPETALRLVHARAQAMAAACQHVDGTMAAVIGMDEAAVRTACVEASENGSSVELANLNAPGQLVVSGARQAVARLSQHARAAGAKRVLPLNVSGPFHSAYMRPAADALASSINAARFNLAVVPVVLNVSTEPAVEPSALRHELSVQLYSPVRWIESVHRLAQLGCDRFLEIGPGQVLAGMVRRTLPGVNVASFGCLADLDAARALIGAG